MKKLRLLLQPLLSLFLTLALYPAIGVGSSQGGPYTLTKDLPGTPGGATQKGGDYSLTYSAGEPWAGGKPADTLHEIASGYYSGRFGNGQAFRVLRSAAGLGGFSIQGVRVGIPVQTSVTVDLSDLADQDSVPAGITVYRVRDHLGNADQSAFPVTPTYTPTGQSVILAPSGNWEGNTLYDVVATPALHSIDGDPLEGTVHFQFTTLLDPHLDNVVATPLTSAASGVDSQRAPAASSSAALVRLPADSLTDYAAVLVNSNPLTAPMSVDPRVIADANRKALQEGGSYQAPVAVREIAAYDAQGQALHTLVKAGQITLPFAGSSGLVSGAGSAAPVVRVGTLAVWVLDTSHHRWVKIPDSRVDARANTVTAPFTQFGTYALMGSASGNAADVFVFPIPWRPHGPNAGTGTGQTGTEEGGMTFSNLPSECTIRIYTLSGERIRDIHHTDLGGTVAQERWDGATANGDHASSGVYLWRIESSQDAKNGKLMIIR